MTHRTRIVIATALLGLLVAIAPGCGKSSTNPGGGGGGTKELDSGILGAGAMYAHTFANAGTYGYHCVVHGTAMSGSVTVANGGSSGASVSIGDNFYNPNSVTIAPGTTVTWTRNGSNQHSVTSN